MNINGNVWLTAEQSQLELNEVDDDSNDLRGEEEEGEHTLNTPD